MLNIDLIKIVLFFPFLIFFYLISSYKKNLCPNYSIFFLSAFIIFYTILEYVLIGNHNIYEWLAILDLVVVEHTINNQVLFNDFYTMSSLDSPKIYFAKFVSLMTLRFFEHISFLYLLKLIIIFFKPLLIFLILNNFTSKNKYYLFNNSPFTKSISALFAIGYLNFIHPSTSLGWSSFVSWSFINTLNFSTFLGLLAIYLFQKYSVKNLIGVTILFLSIFMHPIGGLINFIIVLLLFNNFNKFNDLLLLFTHNKLLTFIVIIIPYTFIILNLQNTQNITENLIEEIAVINRHSHHLVISSFFNFKTFIWLSLPLFAYLYSIYLRNNKGQIYSILIFLITSGGFLIQYFFTEVYFFSTIAFKLQPNRILSHSSFLYIILLFICINNKSIDVNKYSKSILRSFRFFIILSFLFFIVTGFMIKKKPLQWDIESQKIIEYVNEISLKKGVYYSEFQYEWLLSFIRAYNKKTIYSDKAFPFNLNKIKEWNELNENGIKFRLKLASGYLVEMCDINNYPIDFYIYKNENKLLQEYSKKINNQTFILDVNAFKNDCNVKFLN